MISGEMVRLISKREKLVHLMAIPLFCFGTLFQGKIGSKSYKKAEFGLYRWSFKKPWRHRQEFFFFWGGGERWRIFEQMRCSKLSGGFKGKKHDKQWRTWRLPPHQLRRRHLVPPWEWPKNLGRGFSLNLPRWEKKIYHISKWELCEGECSFFGEIYLCYLPSGLVDWVNLVSSPVAIDSVHTRKWKKSSNCCKCFFVNSARVHGYPLWMFLDISEWILEKTAENQVMMTKHVRGEYKKFVELGRHWWQLSWHFEILKISCFAVKIWIGKFHLQTVGLSVVIVC